MPVYEYKCDECSRVFEVRQRFSDDPVTVCETCGGKVERLISAPAFHFKGSGWYVTDYAKGGNSPAPTSKGASDKAESGSDSKSETKTASKPDSSSSSSTPSSAPSTTK